MPLLGTAAMLLSFDVAAEAIAEHDHWHTHEHLAERLSIPGFRRGTRWIALEGELRYMVLYEVQALETLTSAAYLERLNAPTPWTSRMMPHYRGMRRGLCTVAASSGHGFGNLSALLRFQPAPGAAAGLQQWLVEEVIERLPTLPGLGSAHLLQGAVAAPMTSEQKLRGADQGMDWALIVSAYRRDALEQALASSLGTTALQSRGASHLSSAMYRFDYSTVSGDVAAR